MRPPSIASDTVIGTEVTRCGPLRWKRGSFCTLTVATRSPGGDPFRPWCPPSSIRIVCPSWIPAGIWRGSVSFRVVSPEAWHAPQVAPTWNPSPSQSPQATATASGPRPKTSLPEPMQVAHEALSPSYRRPVPEQSKQRCKRRTSTVVRRPRSLSASRQTTEV